MEYRRGSRNEWFVIAECSEEGVEDEPFTLELACELIGNTTSKWSKGDSCCGGRGDVRCRR